MIVDFPQIKARLNRLVNLHLMRVHKQQVGILNEIRNHALHEGDAAKYQTVDNEEREVDLQLLTSKFEVTWEEIRDLKIIDVFAFYEKMSAEIANQQQKAFFRQIDDEVDNKFDGSLQNPSELFLEALRTIHVDFDEVRERPRMPTIIVHPTTGQKLKQHFESMSPEQIAEHETETQTILDRKYEEYLLREGNRKLVD